MSARSRLVFLRRVWLVSTVCGLAAAAGLCATGASAAVIAPFSIQRFSMQTVSESRLLPDPREGGHFTFENVPYSFTQAGGHPWALSTTYAFPTETYTAGHRDRQVVPTQDVRDIVTDLPAGLLGNPNPTVFPRCALSVVLANERCPADTQIGVFRVQFSGGGIESLAPVVNVVPEKGQSAEFALETDLKLTFLLTAHVVRVHEASGAETYGLTVTASKIAMNTITEVETTFWGVPGDPSHDAMRGMHCGAENTEAGGDFGFHCTGGGVASGLPRAPFLTWPTSCSSGPLVSVGRVDSWEEPGSVSEGRYAGYHEATSLMPGVTGCGSLRFEPGLSVRPDSSLADSPVEMGVDLTVPQGEGEDAGALAPPQLRDATVTFPQGVSISPGIVDGIRACNESGPEGINFTGPESEEAAANGELQLAPGHCPDASKIGEAEAVTPLQNEPVKGNVYLARPGCGGPGQHECTERDAADGNLYQQYLELGGTGALADAGVNLKVRLKTEADPATGQLTTVAEDNPQFPFSDLKIKLNGGPRAGLDNPPGCGPAVATSDLVPWSAPGTTPEGLFMAGTPDATPSSEYVVSGCSSPVRFVPGFLSGTVSPTAGRFSAFTMNLSREDREQYIKGIQVHTPPGLLAMLSSVPLCGEADANSGHCPEASRIGTAMVASGAGSHPFEITGSVYLTGPHDGAPFGLSIVTHVIAGPFDLGLVVVRARIDIDRTDSSATITTDETGSYAIPQIVFGVPLRLRRVTVNIDRPGFMFNPTNCNALQVSANVTGDRNALAHVSSPFAAGDCQRLAFKPSFTVSTSARTSKANGASLDARVSYPPGAMGTQANIAYVKVELPKQLPSRLTTLQKACTAAQFENNPAGCPGAAIVGIARAVTPLLPVALSGPVYFVSHGGESFPSLIVVLQGDGVRVDLTGSTFISKAGITSSTFKTVPDVPVSSFELYLPEGPSSALTANTSLCATIQPQLLKRRVTRRVHGHVVKRMVTVRESAPGLVMPSEFVAQNGTIMKQNTRITVTGCNTTATTGKAARNARARATQASHTAKHRRTSK